MDSHRVIQVPAGVVARDEGTIVLAVGTEPNTTDGREVRFPTFVAPELQIEMRSFPSGILEVELIGLMRQWVIIRGVITPEERARMVAFISWKRPNVELHINGRLVATAVADGLLHEPDPIFQLASILGDEWLQKELQRPAPTSHRHQDQRHPFARFFSTYSQFPEARRRALIGHSTHELVALAIGQASKLKGFTSRIPQLQTGATYRDVASEMLSFALLRELFAEIELLEERRNLSTPDLRGLTPAGLSVSAESKRVRSFSTELETASKQWPDVAARIGKALNRLPVPLDVHIQFTAVPKGEEFAALARDLEENHATAGLDWEQLRASERWTIFARRRAVRPMETEHIPPAFADPDCSWAEFQTKTKEGRVELLSYIGCELRARKFVPARFERPFREAVSQLPEEGPGVIAIEIPELREEAGVGQLREWVGQQFRNGSYSRVNLVVVFWVHEGVEHRVVAGQLYTKPSSQLRSEVVVNPNPRSPWDHGLTSSAPSA